MLNFNSLIRGSNARASRRCFLQAGALGTLGLSLPALLRAGTQSPAHGDSGFGRAKRCLLVFLNGGPSQLDMWDMKPHAPAEIRGELNPIATTVPGMQIGELLPLTARHAEKYKIVRSVTHEDTEHTTSMCTMLTGTYHPRPKIAQIAASPHDHPNLGAIFSKVHGWKNQLPPFVSLPTLFQPPGNGIWPGQDGGFLGKRYSPFVIRGEKKTAHFTSPEISLPAEISSGRLDARRSLLNQLSTPFRSIEESTALSDVDQYYQQAFSLISSNRLTGAVDLSSEAAATRDRYGRHLFGQGLLMARRLLEANVPLATLYWIDPQPPGAGGGEYDSHGRIYHHMRNRLVPPTDQALSALFGDLSERNLLDDTLVVVMAEFGRTPRINGGAGRDHWPHAMSILLAGAGITGGSIFGATDKHAAYPTSQPVTPPDLAQTILHRLGVPADLELHDQQNRPVPACRGTVIPDLFA